MNITRNSRFFITVATATLGALAFTACATATVAAGPEAASTTINRAERWGVNDNDPRGFHGPLAFRHRPRVPISTSTIADHDPRGLHGLPKPGTYDPGRALVTSTSPVNDHDPRGLHGLPTGAG